jgi:hypothetical protein
MWRAMKCKTKTIKIVLSIVLALSILAFSVNAIEALLSPIEIGFDSKSRSQNYDDLLDALFSNGKVVTSFDNKLWVPWFSSSSECGLSYLKSGNSCNSGQTIDFSHNCMVTDEFSQVGILVAMGRNQQRMDNFYNTVLALKSNFGNIPAWRAYRDGNTIIPCKPGINGNCDTASDATARIISALYTASANSLFINQAQKSAYKGLANQLSKDFLQNEVDQTCRSSNLGYGNICYWLAAGSQVKKGGFASGDYAYTGYYADAIIAMLQACYQTGNQQYCDAAKDFVYNYYQASDYKGDSFKVPPGRSFNWDISSGYPKSVCSQSCSPVIWDDADASRALGMCQANYYANSMGIALPGLKEYCSKWGNLYMNNPSSAPVQYRPDGSAGNYISGYLAQGLQALFQSGGHNPGLFGATLDKALSHYNPTTKTWDNQNCFGVYTTAFSIRALGFGIGRDLASFTNAKIVFPDPIIKTPSENQDTPINNYPPLNNTNPDTQNPAKTPSENQGIGKLSVSCSLEGNECGIKSDSVSGVCRNIFFNTDLGQIEIFSCEKEDNTIEVYLRKSPASLSFSACIDKGCVSNKQGFSKFTPTYSPDEVAKPPPACIPFTEICDNLDNDCDSQIDEDYVCIEEKNNTVQPVPEIIEQPVVEATSLKTSGGGGGGGVRIIKPIFEPKKEINQITEIQKKPDIQLTKDFPVQAEQGKIIPVRLFINNAEENVKIIINEIIPKGAVIKDWKVTGSVEKTKDIKFIQNGRALAWEFTSGITNPTVEYHVRLPVDGEIASFSTVYNMKNGIYTKNVLGNAGGDVSLLKSAAEPKPNQQPKNISIPFIPNTGVNAILFIAFTMVLAGFIGLLYISRFKKSMENEHHHAIHQRRIHN